MKMLVLFVMFFVLTLVGAVVHAQWPTSIGNLRYQLIGDEPIAAPDGRGLVGGWKAIVIRDVKSNQCYFGFVAGTAMSLTGPNNCP